MKRTLPLLLALLVLLVGGAVYGLWTQRWGHSDALAEAAGRLEHLPESLPGWQVEPEEVDTQAMVQAGAVRWWARRFTRPRSGESATVIVMCGRSGRMSVHLPQQCYRSAGYSVETAPVQRALPDGDRQAQLWTARFSRQEAGGMITLRIYWSWFGDNTWQAPTAPRWTFAPLPALYKLYVIHELPPHAERADSDLGVALLEQLLPVLSDTLGGGAAPTASPRGG